MEVFFYRDKNGDEPVANYLRLLKANDCKDNRINLQKIQDYISLLELRGTSLGEPYIKHIEDELWELRPIRNRIFFAMVSKDRIILLHYFVKKTRRTPRMEIAKAKRNLDDYYRRSTNETDRKISSGK